MFNHYNRIISYLTIHAYAQMWMLPYAYKEEKSPHYNDLMTVAKIATEAIRSIRQTNYSFLFSIASKQKIYQSYHCT